MVGKRVQFDDETWEAIQAVARKTGKSFQELASAAFADLLRKHNHPIGFKAALEASVPSRTKVKRVKQKWRFIKETDIEVIDDETRELVETHWQC
jgi:hypothetical protein